MKIPKSIYTIKSNAIFVVGLALFAMLFALIYAPTYTLNPTVKNMDALADWYSHQNLCLPVCCAIILVSTAMSRFLLLSTSHRGRLSEGEFLLWQMCEVVVTGLFGTLFLSLYLQRGFLALLSTVLLVYISIAIFPYAIYWLLMERMDRDQRLSTARHAIMALRRSSNREDEAALRFSDEKGNVKLVVCIDSIIAIESAGNYVNILYETGGKLLRYSLRNTLKGVEELCRNHSLVRCHRSYFINLHKVKLLRKENDGIYAEIDHEGVGDIPVSKSYAADVMQRFSEKS